jgi:UDP-glucose 4-epimerase
MHFAADSLIGESVQNPAKYFNNNMRNSLQLIEIMTEYDIKKIVFSSSAAVYGEPKTIPIEEDHPCLPTNPYGETNGYLKRHCRLFMMHAC